MFRSTAVVLVIVRSLSGHVPRDWISAVLLIGVGAVATCSGTYFLILSGLPQGSVGAILLFVYGVLLLCCGVRVALDRALMWDYGLSALLLISANSFDAWLFRNGIQWPNPLIVLIIAGWGIAIWERSRKSPSTRGDVEK
jgi:hypothetical protein